MQIGSYKIYSIETGRIALDGGAMYGVVPKVFWEKTNPPDDRNRIILTTRHLVLVSDGRKILIDTGAGENWDEKFAGIYNIDHSSFNLYSALQGIGISPDEITDVILTHLHFDHTGGSINKIDGKILPAFPNATYYVQKKHYDWALQPSKKDGASFIKERFVPLHEYGILKLLNEDAGFDDNISFVLCDGHTFSQQLVKICDGSNTILYCADLLPLHTHIALPYIMAYDLQPLKTIEEKEKILPQAVDENWLLFFEHDPYISAATIKHSGKGITIDNKFEEFPTQHFSS
jgi:glyoxylase-like metal-dependent hydrolase (beta-lactamase superfamily II)